VGGGGGGLPGTSPPVQAVGAQVASGYIPADTLSSCYSSVSFFFPTFLRVAASWAGLIKIFALLVQDKTFNIKRTRRPDLHPLRQQNLCTTAIAEFQVILCDK
jgi:hypothetical protein